MKKIRKLFGIQFDNNTFKDLNFIMEKDGNFNKGKAQQIRLSSYIYEYEQKKSNNIHH